MEEQRKNRLPKQYKRVMIVRFTALSDVAMTVPVVYSVCDAYPDTNFVMVTRHVASTLFVNKPANLDVEGVNLDEEFTGLTGLYKLYKYLKAEYNPEVVIDLHDDAKTRLFGMFFKMGGAKLKKINTGNSEKRALTRRHNKRMLPLISTRERYREVFYRAGFAFNETFSSLFGETKPEPSIFAEISEAKQAGECWIAIAPFAKHKEKIYPIHLMKKVLDEVVSWQGVKVFLFGRGEAEQKVLDEWAKEYENVTSLATKRYGFPAELSLLSYCDVMVSMDSANMHLASLVCLPVVSVWGATHPYCGFMGWHQDPRNAVQINVLCRPCSVLGDKPCRYNDTFCLSGISPTLIVARIKDVIER